MVVCEFCVILWLMNWSLNVQGQYTISTSSTVDHVPCILAQPPLTFNAIKVMAAIGTEYIGDDKLWVGYYRTPGIFNYKGCVLQNNIKNRSTEYPLAEKRPGFCYFICSSNSGKDTFGIDNENCYCFRRTLDGISVNETQCGNTCRDQENVMCGGEGGSTRYLSLYSYEEEIRTSIDNNECMFFEPTNKKVGWAKCSQPYLPMCFNGTYTHATPAKYGNWSESVKYCLRIKELPTDYNSSYLVDATGGSEIWTGVIRSMTILKTESGISDNHVEQGILKPVDNGYVLQFKRDNKSRRALCRDEATSSSAKPITTKSNFKSTVKPSQDSSDANETQTESSPKLTSTSTTSDPKKLVEDEPSGKTGLYVGVIIGVVIVLGIAAVAIVILKRRNIICTKRPEKEHTTQLQEQNDYSEIPETALTNGKVEYTNSQKMKNLDHNYHRVEKQGAGEFDSRPESTYNHPDVDGLSKTRFIDQSEDLDPGHYAHTYFVLENQQHVGERDTNDTYNVTGEHKVTAHQESDNVYNKLDDNSNATYDHMHKFVPGTKYNEAENTYDTKDTVMKTGNVPTARSNQIYRNVGEADESDTYHHLGVKTSVSTDNFYGAPENSSV